MSQATLYNLFADAALSSPGRDALILSDRTVAYAAFDAQVRQLAGRVAELESSGAVGIVTADAEAFLRAFFACAAIGRAAFPLDPALPPAALSKLLSRHRLAALVIGKDAPCLPQLAVPAIPAWAPPQSGEIGPLPIVVPEAAFYWGLTSGTTGESKIFARSHASWTASFEAAEAVFAFPAGSRVMIPGPLHHSLFLYGAVHALCRGHSVMLPGAFRTSRLAAILPQATHLYAVPFMLGELVKAGPKAPALSAVFCGGAKLEAEARRACERLWPSADIAEFYGASETSFLTWHSTRRPAPSGSVGRAFPGVELQLLGATGGIAPQGTEGQIFARSAMLFSGYVGEPAAKGWFSAGDTGFIDAEGCLHLTGRINRIINSKALKIRPELIEAALMELPEVRRAAVVDLPDPRRGTVAVAAIELAEDAIGRSRLSAHCRARLGPRLCPRRFYVTGALPLTSSGKVAVARLREALMKDDPAFRTLR